MVNLEKDYFAKIKLRADIFKKKKFNFNDLLRAGQYPVYVNFPDKQKKLRTFTEAPWHVKRKASTLPQGYKWYMGSPFWLITLVYDQDIKFTEIPETSNEFSDEMLEYQGKLQKFIRLLIKKLQEYEIDLHESKLVTLTKVAKKRDSRQEAVVVSTTSVRRSSDVHGVGWSGSSMKEDLLRS